MKKIIIGSLLSSLAFVTASASAQVTSNMETNATLNSFCSITAGDLALGQVNGRNTGASALNVLCSKGMTYRVQINSGLNYSVGFRRIKGVASNDLLAYKLYTSSSYVTNDEWVENTNRTFTGTGSVVELPVHARLNSSLSHWNTPDDYSDTLTVTVTY